MNDWISVTDESNWMLGFTVQKRKGDDWAWKVLYPDGRLVDVYASRSQAETVRKTMEGR